MNKICLVFSFFVIVSLGRSVSSFEKQKQTITGKVIAIIDGDTFKLLTADSTQIKVRLANIDCPERKQPLATKSKQFVSNAIFNQIVTVKV